MTDYGVDVFDESGNPIISFPDRLGRLFWYRLVSPQSSGSVIVPSVYTYGTPNIVVSSYSLFTDDEPLIYEIFGGQHFIPESSHTIKYRRIGVNLFVEWQPAPWEGRSSLFELDPTDWSIVFAYGY
jgi:hypothetical protein